MAYEAKDVYAALGMEVPGQQSEVADPTGQGENDPSLAGTDGRNQAADSTWDGTDGFGNSGSVDPCGKEDGGPTTAEAASSAPAGEGVKIAGAASSTTAGDGTEDTGDERTDSSTSQDGEPAPNGAQKDKPETMSKAERAEQARLRRERERQQAIQAAVAEALRTEREKHDADVKAMFADAGMVDRYHDNKPITSMDEFREFQKARSADKLTRDLQGGRLTPESLQAAVDASPAVQAAKAAVERLEAREQAQNEATVKAEFEQRVKEELAEIHSMDPSVNTLEDILALPTGNAFAGYVQENGLSFLAAFKLANADRMAEARARAAREGAARNAGSKGHLRSIVGPAGGVATDVPKAVLQLYRDLRPDMTMEQIRQDYARTMRG